MSRSLVKNARVYDNGYDLSGHARTIGPLKWTFEEGVDDPMNATLKGTHIGQANIGLGALNAIFDNTATTGSHARLSAPGGKHTVIVACGMEAAPVANVPAFCGQFSQADYPVDMGANPVVVTVNYNDAHAASTNLLYANPWGVLLHPSGAEDDVNAGTGHDGGGQTTHGGYMVYQVLSAAGTGDITCTFKVQDASTNSDGSFGDLLTSGVINCGSSDVSVPTHGLVALSPTATVKQFTRWQIVLGTATSVTFVLAFVRGI